MSRTALPFAVVFSLCVAVSAVAAPDATYTALRAIRPDGRTIAVNNFVFQSDVIRFTLNGKLHLLTPVEGKTSGAVFIGQGSYELTPAAASERYQLSLHANDEKLTSIGDQFDSAVFLGTALVNDALKL